MGLKKAGLMAEHLTFGERGGPVVLMLLFLICGVIFFVVLLLAHQYSKYQFASPYLVSSWSPIITILQRKLCVTISMHICTLKFNKA